ncbi:hypothetical protein [Metapseudomonas furukawaii]|uniref:Uncharacterized protein n=1 Tax=Metapseudomonas furukawaii TaxID=1149133 RepID=A0AAD1C1N4_METFU|nr:MULTISPECIES: hypothetical protein [Pseudomonas]ELS24151.1 hypothetical protein ppKF707_4724 [Pseudomonas furukawaii]OWJ91590.1 hypothetical protein B6S59_23715 [Pseudomonas sp. A46]BAU74931.1 hypothetical protein KF707C_32430 [Pseudomonas furukawaii]
MDDDLDLHEPEHDHLLDNDDDFDGEDDFDDEDGESLDQPEGACDYCGELTERTDRRGQFVCADCADFD